MNKVAFIGGFDKADLIIYVAKTIVNIGKKVLVVDATVTQKTRYMVPTMKPLKQMITTYENIDIAIGFESLKQIKVYISQNPEVEKFDYDYILFDIDSYRSYYYYEIKPEDKHYFVTGFDIYSVRKGLQVFRKLETPINLTKVYFTKDMLNEEDAFVNFQAKGLKIKWDENIVYFPFDDKNLEAIYANQRSGRIQFGDLSGMYKDGVSFLVEEITGENQANVKKAMKSIG